jgi:hypothetical protein
LIAFHRRLALIGCGFSELSGLAEILAGGLWGSDTGVRIRGVLAVRGTQVADPREEEKTENKTTDTASPLRDEEISQEEEAEQISGGTPGDPCIGH